MVNGKRVTTARAKPVLRIVSLLSMAFVSFKGPATGTAEQHQCTTRRRRLLLRQPFISSGAREADGRLSEATVRKITQNMQNFDGVFSKEMKPNYNTRLEFSQPSCLWTPTTYYSYTSKIPK